MDRKNLSDRGKAIETKTDGKAKKDILRQLCERYHLDSAGDHLPHISSKDILRQLCEKLHLDSAGDHLLPLPDGQRPRALLSRNNEKILFTNIRIVETRYKGNSIIADENIKRGDSIFSLIGVALPVAEATDKSLQITDDLCLESTEGFDNNLNHSCDPNCYFDFKDTKRPVLVALRDIKKGEELSFDYNTTDYDLPSNTGSFDCHCHAPKCLGEIKGYKYLTPEQKRGISPFLAPFLRKIYDEEIREHEDLGN